MDDLLRAAKDGLTFDPKNVAARLRGCDHAEPKATEFPTLLPLPVPKLRMYPRETVVAEKLHAMVYLGLPNSRMKDFFDVWSLCRELPLEGVPLARAVKPTFERRSTPIPEEVPLALGTTS
jgi:hypothetical protein